MIQNTVEVRDAYKFYGKPKDPKIVLNKLNMTVAPGSIYGLMGASGCGKTTLLSSILGIVALNSGRITVLGKRTMNDQIHKAGHKIGYMPQETALIGELSVKETIYYFGNIFQMDIDKLRERYIMLRNLLELPRDDHRVENCSGGQQRRVSLCAALIHEPELLILDEPTVGVDPLLREKIWDFMLHATRTSKLSIIITTHYIEEARQADRCGLMRNGILLAEESPRNIMERYQCDTLEDAFLKLCVKRGASEDAEESFQLVRSEDEMAPIENNNNNDSESTVVDLPKRRIFNKRTMKALMYKNLLQFMRTPAAIIFLSVVPVIQILFFYLAIGGNPIGLKIGIVDDEISDYSECKNSSLITTFVHDYMCDMSLISCRFLERIDSHVGDKSFFRTYDEAYSEARKGNIIAILHFSSNFSQSVQESIENKETRDLGTRLNRIISISMDQTNQQLTSFLRQQFFEIYQN